MSEVKKIATRESYGNALAELGAEYPNIVVLDADLAGATKTGVFKKAFPDRHIDCGIAEGNMMGVAAGLATTGKIPFASSFAMFAAGRAFEQVRNSIGYPHLNVKIGATHAGISVGEDGASHQCNEDIALMRVIPGMVVICPASRFWPWLPPSRGIGRSPPTPPADTAPIGKPTPCLDRSCMSSFPTRAAWSRPPDSCGTRWSRNSRRALPNGTNQLFFCGSELKNQKLTKKSS